MDKISRRLEGKRVRRLEDWKVRNGKGDGWMIRMIGGD
jgi:hypothetical protein